MPRLDPPLPRISDPGDLLTGRVTDGYPTILPRGVPGQVLGIGLTNTLTWGAGDGTAPAAVPVYNVKAYGALGNGVANDTTAIQAAITAASASGGIVHIPIGTYLISTALGGVRNNVIIQGAGRFVSILKQANGANVHVFDVAGTNWGFADIGIDGNNANNTAGQGIRISGDHHWIDTVYIHHTAGYGIGCSQSAGTSLRYATFHNIFLTNLGVDGIDIKDTVSANVANRLSDITVETFDTSAIGDCAGLDCRGPVHLTNISVRGASANGSGIRFRETSVSTGPLGGYQGALSGARLVGDGTTSSYGLTINGSGVSVANVYVLNHWRAFTVGTAAAQVALSQCVADTASSRGFEINALTPTTLSACRATLCLASYYLPGRDITLDGCVSESATTVGYDVRGNRAHLRNCRVAATGGTAVSINASANDTHLSGMDFSQQTGGTLLADSGANTVSDVLPASLKIRTGTDPVLLGERYAADATPVRVRFRKSRHSTPGSHTVVVSGDNLGSLLFDGSDGSAFRSAASITGIVDGTPGASDMPGRLSFHTTPDGSATPVERVRIPSAGGLALQDGITAPGAITGFATLYVDTADGDLKVVFSDGTVKTIVVDT